MCVRPYINPKRDSFRQRMIQGLLNELNPSCMIFGAPFEMFMAEKESKVAIKRSFFELAYFCVLFDHKVDSPVQTPSPTCQTRCIYLIWRPSHRALTRGVSFRIHIQSHTHEKGPFFTTFFLAIFRLIFGNGTSLPDQTPSPTYQTWNI